MNDKPQTHRYRFTQEQVETFRANPWVANVSESTIRFTAESKARVLEQRRAGMYVKSIFRSCGIDPAVLGKSRLKGFLHTLNKREKREKREKRNQ